MPQGSYPTAVPLQNVSSPVTSDSSSSLKQKSIPTKSSASPLHSPPKPIVPKPANKSGNALTKDPTLPAADEANAIVNAYLQDETRTSHNPDRSKPIDATMTLVNREFQQQSFAPKK